MSIQTSDIQLKVDGNTANAYLAMPEGGGPGILLLHAWWGLKPFFKQVCDQLAKQGFTVLAPDLYQGRIATTIDQANIFMEQSDAKLMRATIQAAKQHLVSLRVGQPIGVVGFSMGASWTLDLASSEKDVSTAVLFYGVEGVDFKKISAKILGHFAEVDEWAPMDDVRKVEAEMKAAGLDVTFHVYPKVGHWFVEEDRPEYDSASAILAWSRTFEFLRKHMKA